MIELTREEAIALLKFLSQVDGFLMSIRENNVAAELMEYPVNLLTKKLEEAK